MYQCMRCCCDFFTELCNDMAYLVLVFLPVAVPFNFFSQICVSGNCAIRKFLKHQLQTTANFVQRAQHCTSLFTGRVFHPFWLTIGEKKKQGFKEGNCLFLLLMGTFPSWHPALSQSPINLQIWVAWQHVGLVLHSLPGKPFWPKHVALIKIQTFSSVWNCYCRRKTIWQS